jgi:tripartite-type tricarboxylate transporter receptor subunit TctC
MVTDPQRLYQLYGGMTQMPTPFIALLALLLATTATVAQQNYPTKTVTLMTTFAPGGSSDLISRLVAQKLTEEWKKQVIVDNRPGGAGFIAMQAAARAVPDGHTLILGHIGVLAVNPAMFATLPYDPVKDYAPISLVATVPTVLAVHPSVPAQNLKELIALTKSKPGTYFYGTAGNGSAAHLATEYLKQQTGLDASHVPYKGTGPMITDLLAGQTHMTFTGSGPLMSHVTTGRLRALAVGTTSRTPALPDLPTVAEAGYENFETSQWYGILAPAKTPPATVQKSAAAINRAVAHPDVIARFQHDGDVPKGTTPEEFAAFIASEAKRWGVVVKTAGIKAE